MSFWRDLRPVLAAFWQAQPRRLVLGAALAALTVLMGMALLGLSGWFITATALAGLPAATALALRCLRALGRHPPAGAGPHRLALRRAAGDPRRHLRRAGRPARTAVSRLGPRPMRRARLLARPAGCCSA